MNIGIEASPASFPNKAGIGNYIFSLLSEITKLDSQNKYTIYSLRNNYDLRSICKNNYSFAKMPDMISLNTWLSWAAWTYSAMPLQLEKGKLDCYVSMYPILPFVKPAKKNIIVIYDLTPLMLKGTCSFGFQTVFYTQLLHAISKADKIITISQYSRNDIINFLGVEPDKVEIVYPSYDNSVFKFPGKQDGIDMVRNRYGINGNYILNAGTLEPKKNIIRLIKAFQYLQLKYGITHKLVISGKRTWHDQDVISEMSKSDSIIYTDYVPTIDLALLMQGADVFVFPSLHEGFGLPPIEAMACGTPVITSNTTSLPEVVKESGLQVDPYSIEDIGETMYLLITDQGLRNRLRLSGLKNCQRFSSCRSAQKLLDIIK